MLYIHYLLSDEGSDAESSGYFLKGYIVGLWWKQKPFETLHGVFIMCSLIGIHLAGEFTV